MRTSWELQWELVHMIIGLHFSVGFFFPSSVVGMDNQFGCAGWFYQFGLYFFIYVWYAILNTVEHVYMSNNFLADIVKISYPIFYIYNYFGYFKLFLGSSDKCHNSEISNLDKIQVFIGQNSLKIPRILFMPLIFYQFNWY